MELKKSKKSRIHKEKPQKMKWEKPDVIELSYENTAGSPGAGGDFDGRQS